MINNLEEKKYWIWFSRVKGLGSRRKQILLKMYKTPEKIYNLKKEEILKIKGFNEILADKIIDNNNKISLENYIEKMQKEKISIITIDDKEYPDILKNIYDYPISLYIKGNSNILNNYIPLSKKIQYFYLKFYNEKQNMKIYHYDINKYSTADLDKFSKYCHK